MKQNIRLLAASLLASLATLPAAAKPNIIFIMADDLGWTDTATYGSQYHETPNIDRLAAQGMKFTGFYNCQNCAPSRAALLSGQYAARTGIYTVGRADKSDWHSRPLKPATNAQMLGLDKITIAQSLKNAGYATGMFGKWHLDGGKGPEYHPSHRGFDEAISTMGLHFNFVTNPPEEHPPDAYLADFLTDKAVDFITRHKDEPFFLYLPHFGVHSPYQAKFDLIEKFKAKPGVGGHQNPTYAAMIASVDESVGRIMRTLEDLKLADNTVLIFTSDNGGVGGYESENGLIRDGDVKGKKLRPNKAENSSDDKNGFVTDNTPLRSGKGSLYEGGTRVPFIVRWPGQVKPGSLCAVPTIHVDVYPTLLELAGTPPPASYLLDGESLVPLLYDGNASLKRAAIFQHFPGYLGAGQGQWRTTPVTTMIADDWKLMEFLEDGKLELYNLREDIGETKNLASKKPEKAKELHALLTSWRREVNAPMPTKNDPAVK